MSPAEVAEGDAGSARGTNLARGGVLLMGAKLAHVVASFGLYFFLGALFDRSLGAEGVAALGMWGATMAWINPINMAFAQGSLACASHVVARAPSAGRSVLVRCLRAQGLLVLLGVGAFQLAVPFIATRWLRDPAYVLPLRVGGLIPAAYALRAVYQGVCNGTRRFREQSWLDVGSSLSRAGLVLAAAALGGGATGAVGGALAAAVLMLVVAALWVRPRDALDARVSPAAEGATAVDAANDARDVPPAAATLPSARALLGFQSTVVLVTLVSWALASVDTWIVKAASADDPAVADRYAGYFTIGLKVAQIPWAVCWGLVWALFPVRAQAGLDEAERARLLARGLRVLLLLMVPTAALLCATAEPTVLLVAPHFARVMAEFGDAGAVVWGPLQVQAPGYVAYAVLGAVAMLLTAGGRPRAALLLVGGVLVAALGLAWLAVVPLELGPRGAALGVAAAYALGALVGWTGLAREGAVPGLLSVARVLGVGAVVFAGARALPVGGLALPFVDAGWMLLAFVLLLACGELSVAELRELIAALRRKRPAG